MPESLPLNYEETDIGPAFVLSLDTELAWGTLSTHGPLFNREAYLNTLEAVQKLLKILENTGISATWAVVGHLMTGDKCKKKLSETENTSGDLLTLSLPEHDENDPVFHARCMIEMICNATPEQDIGSHTYSHVNCAECSPEEMKRELELYLLEADKMGVSLSSFVFPYNAEGNHDIIRSYGFRAYRGVEPNWYQNLPQVFKGPLHLMDQYIALTPPTVKPVKMANGLINIPGSMLYLSMEGIRRYIPLSRRILKARRGIDRAVKCGEVFHLWFHPSDLGYKTDVLLDGVNNILEYAASLRDKKLISILNMREISQLITKQQQKHKS